MPPRPHDPSKPTVYLDQSALSGAFKATHGYGNESEHYKPLLPWIERVAHGANLCLSGAHIAEVSKFPPSETMLAERMIAWIDALPTVWVRSLIEIGPLEEDYWTKVSADVAPGNAVDAFSSRLYETFGWGTEALSRLHDPGSIREYVDAGRIYTFEREKERMRNLVPTLHENEALFREAGWDDAKRAKATAYNRRVALRTVARDAVVRLNMRNDPDLGGRKLSQDLQDALVDLYARDARAMPSYRVQAAFVDHTRARYIGMQPGSKNVQKNTPGDFFDYEHASVAAAYCDVFTCDVRSLPPVASVRAGLGLGASLAPAGDVQGFVSSLVATFPLS